MEIQHEKTLMVKCECYSDAIEFQYWPEDKQFYISIWQQGFRRPLGWYQRIRWTIKLLFTGNLWGDSIILSPEKAKEISNFIHENL